MNEDDIAQRRRDFEVSRFRAEHAERLKRFREQAERTRERDVKQIAVDVLGVAPADVARALRGNLTKEDEES